MAGPGAATVDAGRAAGPPMVRAPPRHLLQVCIEHCLERLLWCGRRAALGLQELGGGLQAAQWAGGGGGRRWWWRRLLQALRCGDRYMHRPSRLCTGGRLGERACSSSDHPDSLSRAMAAAAMTSERECKRVQDDAERSNWEGADNSQENTATRLFQQSPGALHGTIGSQAIPLRALAANPASPAKVALRSPFLARRAAYAGEHMRRAMRPRLSSRHHCCHRHRRRQRRCRRPNAAISPMHRPAALPQQADQRGWQRCPASQ